MSYVSEVLADSPKGYWKLNEASGSSFADSATSGLGTGTLTGTLAQYSVASDSGGTGVRFDTTTAYITAGSSSSMPSVATIEAWVYVSALPIGDGVSIYSCAASYGSTTSDKNLRLNANGSLTWYCFTGSATALVSGAGVITTGAWHHVVASIGAAGMKIYVDGTQVASNGATSSAAYTGFGFIHGAGSFPDTNSLATGAMRLSDVAFYNTQLSGTRVSAHYAAAGSTTTTGTVTAAASAPSVLVSGNVATTGTVTATASAPTVLVSGVLPTTGTVTAAASAPTVLVSGNVAGITSGTVQATASAPTVLVSGGVPTPVTGTVNATASAPSVKVSDSTTLTEIQVGVTVEAGTLTVTTAVVLAETEIPVGAGLDSGTLLVIVPLEGTTVPIGLSVVGRSTLGGAPDPRTQTQQWRYVVTELDGTPLGELVDIEHDPLEDGVNVPTTMKLRMASDDPSRALIEEFEPMARKCQVWEGDRLLLWGPVLPDLEDGDGTAGYTVHDPSWWLRGGRRVVGRLPRLDLLRNGNFMQGLTYWTRGFDADSIPAASPAVTVVSEDLIDDTDGIDPIKAARIVGVESVTVTESELSSNAVFWPNLATFRPGGVAAIEAVANAMPTTAGLKVSVVGHTANDGTGPGWDLSKRRADAAAAIIHGKRPLAVISTKGVGYTDPKPGYPIDSQAQRRVVISYQSTTTVSAKAKQWIKQTVTVTQPKSARYELVLTAAALVKIADDWSVADANMTTIKVVARRGSSTKPWDAQKGIGETSYSDTDPVDRWLPATASVTIPADGRAYNVDVYLYAAAAATEYALVALWPEEMLYFWGQDQALIFKGLVEHFQDTTMGHGDLGIETLTPLTGVKRDRTYPHREHMPADTALEEFASLYRGMDYETLMLPDNRVIMATYYPRQGQHVDYTLVQGGNVVRATPERSRDVASSIIMQAQDLGPYRGEAYARDKTALGGLLLERVVTAEQGTPVNELTDAARQELAWGRSSTSGFWLDIDPGSIGEVSAATGKGDTVRLILDFPRAIDRLVRIIGSQRAPGSLRLLVSLEES